MARKSKDEAQKTRTDIMSAAERVFYERGVRSASLHEIAQVAGVTRGAVYWHFKDKVELLKAIADQDFLPHEALLDHLVAQELDNPLEVMCERCIEKIGEIINNPVRRRVFTILMHRCEYLPEMQTLLKRNNECEKRVYDRLTLLLQQAAQKKLLAPNWSPEIAALALQKMIMGFIFTEMEWPKPSKARNAARDAAISAFFQGLSAGKKLAKR